MYQGWKIVLKATTQWIWEGILFKGEIFFFPSLRFLYLMCAFKALLSEMVIKYLMSVSVVGLQLDMQITCQNKYKF